MFSIHIIPLTFGWRSIAFPSFDPINDTAFGSNRSPDSSDFVILTQGDSIAESPLAKC